MQRRRRGSRDVRGRVGRGYLDSAPSHRPRWAPRQKRILAVEGRQKGSKGPVTDPFWHQSAESCAKMENVGSKGLTAKNIRKSRSERHQVLGNKAAINAT
jgi:hypothetical protein